MELVTATSCLAVPPGSVALVVTLQPDGQAPRAQAPSYVRTRDFVQAVVHVLPDEQSIYQT